MRVKIKKIKEMQVPSGFGIVLKSGVTHFLKSILELKVLIQRNYYDGFDTEFKSRVMTLKEYFDDKKPDNQFLCTEHPLDKKSIDRLDIKVPKNVLTKNAVCLVHAGKKGSKAPLHFDWDFSYIIHFNIKGTKVFYFFPPESGSFLDPVLNTSSIDFAKLSDEDKSILVKKYDGYKVIIKTGDGILFPALWWHCVDYTTDSIGISVRFEKDPSMRPLLCLPRSYFLQRIIWKNSFKDRKDLSNNFIIKIVDILFSKSSWLQKYNLLGDFYRSELSKIDEINCPTGLKAKNFETEIILAQSELKSIFTINVLTRKYKKFIPQVEKYIFATRKLPKDLQTKLSTYAISKMQGLEPRIGTIGINSYEKRK